MRVRGGDIADETHKVAPDAHPGPSAAAAATDMGAGEPVTCICAGDRLSSAHLCYGVR